MRAGLFDSRFFLIAIMITLTVACKPARAAESTPAPADRIYWGGDILTMASDQPEYVEAVAVADGRIIATGSKAKMMKHQAESTRVVDLGGKTLLPGFYDSHSHFYLNGINIATRLHSNN